MTTTDPFTATPPLIKSSKPRGKPRIPEAGLHPGVSSKQRCTLYVCLKWKHELVLASTASKAAASKLSGAQIHVPSDSPPHRLRTKVSGRSQPTGGGASAEQQTDWPVHWRRSANRMIASHHICKRTKTCNSQKTSWQIRGFFCISRRMFFSSSFCPCPSPAALCDFPFLFKLSVLNAKGNEAGLFYTQVIYPLRKGASCCAN